MRNSLSVQPVIPQTFADCYPNGQLDIMKYQLYLLLKRKGEEEEQRVIDFFQERNEEEQQVFCILSVNM